MSILPLFLARPSRRTRAPRALPAQPAAASALARGGPPSNALLLPPGSRGGLAASDTPARCSLHGCTFWRWRPRHVRGGSLRRHCPRCSCLWCLCAVQPLSRLRPLPPAGFAGARRRLLLPAARATTRQTRCWAPSARRQRGRRASAGTTSSGERMTARGGRSPSSRSLMATCPRSRRSACCSSSERCEPRGWRAD